MINKGFKLVEQLEKSTEPLVGKSAYQLEYFLKENTGIVNRVKKNSNQSTFVFQKYSLLKNDYFMITLF
jgi:hypothetical protein